MLRKVNAGWANLNPGGKGVWIGPQLHRAACGTQAALKRSGKRPKPDGDGVRSQNSLAFMPGNSALTSPLVQAYGLQDMDESLLDKWRLRKHAEPVAKSGDLREGR